MWLSCARAQWVRIFVGVWPALFAALLYVVICVGV